MLKEFVTGAGVLRVCNPDYLLRDVENRLDRSCKGSFPCAIALRRMADEQGVLFFAEMIVGHEPLMRLQTSFCAG